MTLKAPNTINGVVTRETALSEEVREVLPSDLTSNNIESSFTTEKLDREGDMGSGSKLLGFIQTGIVKELPACWCGKIHKIHPCGDVI